MGLENVWIVCSWVCNFCFAPVFISALLTANPFWTEHPHEGWWARITKELAAKRKELSAGQAARHFPFRVPLWLMFVTYLIVAAMFVIPTYLTHHAGGGNDGWNVDPVPLVFAVLTIGFTNIWMLIYLNTSSEECTNISIVQVLSVITAFMAFFFMLPRHSAWWSLGIVVYNCFWAVKVYIEERRRCTDISPILSGARSN